MRADRGRHLDSGAAKELFGDNYACAKLPTFEADGQEYQMSGFGGFKLLGVKPQTDTNKAIVCMELAKYLSTQKYSLPVIRKWAGALQPGSTGR